MRLGIVARAGRRYAAARRYDGSMRDRLDRVEHPTHAARFNSVGRLSRLNELRTGDPSSRQLVAGMLAPPIRNEQFEVGLGTLYTAEYQPATGVATWHWLETSWTRGFDDPDDIREVRLA